MGSQTCTDDGCSKPTYARRLCVTHYQKARYHGTIPTSEAVERPCAHCGELMAGRVSNRAKFCSPTCKEAARTAVKHAEAMRRRVGRICEQCGGALAESVSSKAR